MIDALARLLGIRPDQTEDAIHSERAAKATLDRRGFLKFGAVATGALATGAIWSMPAVAAPAEVVAVVTGVGRASGIFTFDRLLKELYTDSKVERLIYADSPFLSAIRRDDFEFRATQGQNVKRAKRALRMPRA